MCRITWPMWKLHIWNPRPHFTYSLFNFYGATMTIKGSLLLSIPIVKPFSAKKFQSRQNRSPKWRFFTKLGVWILFVIFKTPKRHILAWDRVFWHILREDQFWGLGCSLFEEPKKRNNSRSWGVIFHPYGEKNPWSDLHKILHRGDVQDVITNANLGDDRLSHFSVARGQILGFS